MNKSLQIGDRVRVTRGYSNGSAEGAPYALWCAGRVPVGAVGTVQEHESGLCIDFDHHKPLEGYVFGIGADYRLLSTWLERVS